MPDLNKSHVREGEYDDGEERHNLSGAPDAPGKATGTGAAAGGVIGAIVGGGAQATLAGAAAGAVAGPPGVVAGAVVGAAVGAALGAAAGYGMDAADRRGELQTTENSTEEHNPTLHDLDDRASRRSDLDSNMAATEFLDDTSLPNAAPAPQAPLGSHRPPQVKPPADTTAPPRR